MPTFFFLCKTFWNTCFLLHPPHSSVLPRGGLSHYNPHEILRIEGFGDNMTTCRNVQRLWCFCAYTVYAFPSNSNVSHLFSDEDLRLITWWKAEMLTKNFTCAGSPSALVQLSLPSSLFKYGIFLHHLDARLISLANQKYRQGDRANK